MVRKLIILAVLISSFSCRKDVTLELPDYQHKVVIEGSIETGSPAVVFLSNSVPYFGEFDYSRPETAFIKGATVIVSDGILTDTLRELDPALGYLYVGSKLIGRKGFTYTIKVLVNGREFQTSSTIGQPVPLDSLYFVTENDSLGLISQTLSEPAGGGGYYRWFAKRIGKDALFGAPFNSVFDDKFIDGETFDFIYNRGPQPNQVQQFREDPERGYFKRGDTVVVKFCTIGKAEYDFWFTYYMNRSSNGNPFSAPSNIKSMFNDYEHAFGAFVAYSPSFDTIIIPKQ